MSSSTACVRRSNSGTISCSLKTGMATETHGGSAICVAYPLFSKIAITEVPKSFCGIGSLRAVHSSSRFNNRPLLSNPALASFCGRLIIFRSTSNVDYRPKVAYFRFDLGGRSRATTYREREARFASRFGACLTDSFGMNTSAGSSNRALNLRTCSKVRLRCPVMNIETALSEPN